MGVSRLLLFLAPTDGDSRLLLFPAPKDGVSRLLLLLAHIHTLKDGGLRVIFVTGP